MRIAPWTAALAVTAALLVGAPTARSAPLTEVESLINAVGTVTVAQSQAIIPSDGTVGFNFDLDEYNYSNGTPDARLNVFGGGPPGGTAVAMLAAGFTEFEVTVYGTLTEVSGMPRLLKVTTYSGGVNTGGYYNPANELETLTVGVPGNPPDTLTTYFGSFTFSFRTDTAFTGLSLIATGFTAKYTALTLGTGVEVVPEPMTLIPLGIGAALLGLDRARRRG